MKESYGEGVANHTGPESCVVSREAGYRSVDRARCDGVLRGRRPWHVRTHLAREPGDPVFAREGMNSGRIGKFKDRIR